MFLGQFHQHYTCVFFVQKFRTKLFLYLDLRFVLFWRKNTGAKATHNMLVKLTQGRMGKNVGKLTSSIFFRNHMARDGSLSRNCPTQIKQRSHNYSRIVIWSRHFHYFGSSILFLRFSSGRKNLTSKKYNNVNTLLMLIKKKYLF